MGVGVLEGVVVVCVGLLLAGTKDMLSIVTVFMRLKRRVNQFWIAEGIGPTLSETVFQVEDALQTSRAL